jgi:imidazolonepropionase-like amidohydrolase
MKRLKNCRLIPELTEGYDGNYADVMIDDNVIVKITKPGEEADFSGEEFDLSGMTLLPGFFDIHAHLFFTDLNLEKLNLRTPAETAYAVLDFAGEYLKQGYTTVRDAGTAYQATAALSKAAKNGKFLVPDIISSGNSLTPTENGNDEFRVIYAVADGPTEVRRQARKQFEAGNQVIKYMVTGCYLNDSGDPGITIATEDELRAAVEIAKMKGSYVMGHAHGAEGIKLGIRAGLHTIEHGSFIDEEGIEMLKNSEDCYLVPTGGVGLVSIEDGDENYSDEIMYKVKTLEQKEKECINRAYRAGLKLGFGSDLDQEHFVKQPGLEFLSRTKWYDFEYLDILLQATKYSAQIVGMDDRKGTIKVGKNAELVAVCGNPDEDIFVMQNLPKYVFFKGHVIKN